MQKVEEEVKGQLEQETRYKPLCHGLQSELGMLKPMTMVNQHLCHQTYILQKGTAPQL